jgi:hypothetical protein
MICPNLEQGTKECKTAACTCVLLTLLYESVEIYRQTVYLKPAASPSDSRRLVVLVHSHPILSDLSRPAYGSSRWRTSTRLVVKEEEDADLQATNIST